MFDLFFRSIELMPIRERKILLNRCFSQTPVTLEQLGLELGITRERVRQLEAQVMRDNRFVTSVSALRNDVCDFRSGFPDGPLAIELKFMARELLFDEFYFQDHQLDFGHLVANLGLFEHVGEFALFPSKKEFFESIEWPALKLAVEKFPRIRPLCFPQSADDRLISALLAHDGYEKIGQELVVKRKSNLVDKLYYYIILTGKSLPLNEISSLLNQAYNTSSIRQRVKEDSRLKVTADNRVDLATSLAPEYATLPELIRKILIETDGVIPIDDLKTMILKIREFSLQSIVSYASSFPFTLENGLVSLSDQPKIPDRNPHRTKRLYRTSTGWLLRHVVTKETLRGSSITLPMSLTNLFFDSKTGRRIFKSLGQDREYVLDWDGRQPKLQSLRQECLRFGLEPGNQLLIELQDDFIISFAPLIIDTTISGIAGVGQFMGLQASTATPEKVAQYIGCDALGAKSIVDALRIRKEIDLLEAFSGQY